MQVWFPGHDIYFPVVSGQDAHLSNRCPVGRACVASQYEDENRICQLSKYSAISVEYNCKKSSACFVEAYIMHKYTNI